MSVFVYSRIYGGYDLELGICVSKHLLEERHEGEVG